MIHDELTTDALTEGSSEQTPSGKPDDTESADDLALDTDLEATVDAPGKKSRPRLWLAVVVLSNGAEVLLERENLADLRRELDSSNITHVKTIYRAIKKDFTVETQTVRKVSF